MRAVINKGATLYGHHAVEVVAVDSLGKQSFISLGLLGPLLEVLHQFVIRSSSRCCGWNIFK